MQDFPLDNKLLWWKLCLGYFVLHSLKNCFSTITEDHRNSWSSTSSVIKPLLLSSLQRLCSGQQTKRSLLRSLYLHVMRLLRTTCEGKHVYFSNYVFAERVRNETIKVWKQQCSRMSIVHECKLSKNFLTYFLLATEISSWVATSIHPLALHRPAARCCLLRTCQYVY